MLTPFLNKKKHAHNTLVYNKIQKNILVSKAWEVPVVKSLQDQVARVGVQSAYRGA